MWIGCIDRLGWMDMTIDGIYWGGKIGCIGRTEKGCSCREIRYVALGVERRCLVVLREVGLSWEKRGGV